MPSLTITSIPEDLYQQLLSLVLLQEDTLEGFTMRLLKQAVQTESSRQQQQLLTTMKRDRFIPPPGAPNSLELLQEVRR
jgi:hypothetical protein